MLVEGLDALDHLGLSYRLGILHQRGINQLIVLDGSIEDRLEAGGKGQGQEGPESSEDSAECQDGKEGHGRIQVHGPLRYLRCQDKVLYLLVDDDVDKDGHGNQEPLAPPGHDNRYGTADIGADGGNELGNKAAEQGQRQPVGHLEGDQEDRHAGC